MDTPDTALEELRTLIPLRKEQLLQDRQVLLTLLWQRFSEDVVELNYQTPKKKSLFKEIPAGQPSPAGIQLVQLEHEKVDADGFGNGRNLLMSKDGTWLSQGRGEFSRTAPPSWLVTAKTAEEARSALQTPTATEWTSAAHKVTMQEHDWAHQIQLAGSIDVAAEKAWAQVADTKRDEFRSDQTHLIRRLESRAISLENLREEDIEFWTIDE